ncbi:hypothetical protein N7449_009292 [Penicillium cf. viridicatum]|uniref:Uncharacterized protein n=1 Tax=Penicillium cf. viridicatum TaxID=2972119 RepID=A0A9W9M8G0_9EURO|nr:hypothetical protein N7449_009292 [Penicillium cf. viridicatum]
MIIEFYYTPLRYNNPPILGIGCSFLILGTLGLITIVINIYTARNRYWPIMAVLTYTNLANWKE